MFIGLVDADQNPFWPGAVSRIAAEIVVWDLIYVRGDKFAFINRNPVEFLAYRDIGPITGIALYREADDERPVGPPYMLGRRTDPVRAGDMVILVPGHLMITTTLNPDPRWARVRQPVR